MAEMALFAYSEFGKMVPNCCRACQEAYNIRAKDLPDKLDEARYNTTYF